MTLYLLWADTEKKRPFRNSADTLSVNVESEFDLVPNRALAPLTELQKEISFAAAAETYAAAEYVPAVADKSNCAL